MHQRISIACLIVMIFVATSRNAWPQAVDVPIDVIVPIEFDTSTSADRPNTMSLPVDFEHAAILSRARISLDDGDDSSVTHQLARLLRLNTNLENDTLVRVGEDNVGLREQVTQFVLRLPPSAREAYVAQLEPEAAIALATVGIEADVSYADVANQFPGTPSSRAALLRQATLEYDRGRRAIAIEYLRRLQNHSANGRLPHQAQRLAEVCFATERCGVANQSVVRPWSAVDAGSDYSEEQLERVAAHMLAVPAVRAVAQPGSVISSDLQSVNVFDQLTGEIRFRVDLDHAQSEVRFAGEGATPWFSADEQRLFVVQRYESDRRSSPNQYTKQRQIDPHVFPVWPPDDYMNTPVAVISSKIVAFDLNHGALLWSAGGLNFKDPALRDATICGAPFVDRGEVFVLAEAKNTLRLIVLDAFDGRTLWKQQVGWADRSINEDLDRAQANCSPLVCDDLILCPTAAGKLVAVSRVTRCLKWAHEYTTSSVVQFEHHHVFSPENVSTGYWLGDSVSRRDDFVVVTAPDSDELLCIDVPTGRTRWHQPRGDNLYVAHLDSQHVWTLAPTKITKWRLADGSVAKPVDLPSTVTGIAAVHRGQIIVSTTGGLISIDPRTSVVTKPKSVGLTVGDESPVNPFKRLGGNLTSNGSALIESSASGVRLFDLDLHVDSQ